MAELAIPGVEVRLEKNSRPPLESKIVSAKISGKRMLWALAGIIDRTTAEAWAGAAVLVDKAALPAANEDEYFDFELLGAAVSDPAGTPLGVVREILPTGANDVLVAHGPRGEVLIPATHVAILAIDRTSHRIVVDPRALVYEE
jgi:16S rRNA processing protein RimM